MLCVYLSFLAGFFYPYMHPYIAAQICTMRIFMAGVIFAYYVFGGKAYTYNIILFSFDIELSVGFKEMLTLFIVSQFMELRISIIKDYKPIVFKNLSKQEKKRYIQASIIVAVFNLMLFLFYAATHSNSINSTFLLIMAEISQLIVDCELTTSFNSGRKYE